MAHPEGKEKLKLVPHSAIGSPVALSGCVLLKPALTL